MTDEQIFRLEEYKALRSEILEQIKEAYVLEKYALAGVLASLTWLLTNATDYSGSVRIAAWILPLSFVVLALLRSWGLLSRMMGIAKHLKNIELEYTERGWETFLRRDYNKLSTGRLSDPSWRAANWPSLVSALLWLLLLVGTGFTAQQCASSDRPAEWCAQKARVGNIRQ